MHVSFLLLGQTKVETKRYLLQSNAELDNGSQSIILDLLHKMIYIYR